MVQIEGLMKIKDLKELIKDLPDDMDVFIDDGKELLEGNKWYYSLRELSPVERRVGEMEPGRLAVAQRACKETKNAKKGLVL